LKGDDELLLINYNGTIINFERIEKISIEPSNEYEFSIVAYLKSFAIVLGRYETRAEAEEELNQLIHCYDIGVKVFEFQQDKGVPFE